MIKKGDTPNTLIVIILDTEKEGRTPAIANNDRNILPPVIKKTKERKRTK